MAYGLQRRIVVAYFISATDWSGLSPVSIKEADNGNFRIPSLITMFASVASLETAVLKVIQKGRCVRFLCIFDHALHNDGTDNCPYLIFCLCHVYAVENCMEDDVLSIAELIHKYVSTTYLPHLLIVAQDSRFDPEQRLNCLDRRWR